MIYDPKSLVNTRPGINPASYTTAQSGAAIDTLGFEYALVVLHFGALTDTANLVLKVQDSPTTTSGDFVDITGASYTVIENADDNSVKAGLVRLHGKRRYIRAVSTVGNTDACVYSVSVILFSMDYEAALRQSFVFEVL